ncbi:hypothetical protein [Falsirhodobacter sp. 20TX0035]|uniref:hypothetical protein n=1 Tax=Falsirhodobacter sp. 20TX0035 TaxID=3022019 RepID=UPI00232DB539|nr:hypothetical protein [Falsirhodobacter sp. 20TX0035]MDB6454681.1 hypothetical protein [Falsirhodobacter sp. 20TX0035]
MKVIVPDPIASLTTNVPEDDYPAWANGTTYASGARVITAASHQVWQSVQAANTGHSPTTDDGTWWVLVGATDRYKPFDAKLSDAVTRQMNMSWTVTPVSRADGLALFGVGASSVNVKITASGSTLYDQTFQILDTSAIVDWYSFFTYEPEYDTQMILTGLPGLAGSQIAITLQSVGAFTSISEIVVGRVNRLGTSLEGTSIGITDYSIKERDEWGNPVIVQRAFADTTTFQFEMPPTDARRVKTLLSRLRATAAVYFVDETATDLGATVFGFFSDFDIPLTHGSSFATLEIEGLV